MYNINDYISVLFTLCKSLAAAATLAEDVELGSWEKKSTIKNVAESLSEKSQVFLDIKKELGFEDELEFTEDNSFVDGFFIENGVLSGDRKKAMERAAKWLKVPKSKLNNEVDRYRYECGCYIMALALYQE